MKQIPIFIFLGLIISAHGFAGPYSASNSKSRKPASEACYQLIRKVDREFLKGQNPGTRWPALAEKAIPACESQMVPDFRPLYDQMVLKCEQTWSSETTMIRKFAVLHCRLNAARFVDSLNDSI